MKKCVFCQKSPPEVKITKEHILRKAIKKLLPVDDATFRWSQRMNTGTSQLTAWRVRHFPTGPFDQTINRVCKQCNEGWLATDVEQVAEEYLFPLIKGEWLPIDRKGAWVLSMWAAKTAAISALREPLPCAASQAQFTWLMEQLCPDGLTHVWMGKCDDHPVTWLRQISYHEGDLSAEKAYGSTVVIGQVVFFTHRFSTSWMAAHLEPLINTLENYSILRIWPPRKETRLLQLPVLPKEIIVHLSSGIWQNEIIRET